jgi:hypothetical protein
MGFDFRRWLFTCRLVMTSVIVAGVLGTTTSAAPAMAATTPGPEVTPAVKHDVSPPLASIAGQGGAFPGPHVDHYPAKSLPGRGGKSQAPGSPAGGSATTATATVHGHFRAARHHRSRRQKPLPADRQHLVCDLRQDRRSEARTFADQHHLVWLWRRLPGQQRRRRGSSVRQAGRPVRRQPVLGHCSLSLLPVCRRLDYG